MARARIPPGTKIWVELGKTYPAEVSFEARTDFKICWVITDGKRRWKYLWIIRRASGLYVAHTLPGGFHESYHADGTRHWKDQKGHEVSLGSGPPLDSFAGWLALSSSTSTITSEALDGYAEFEDEPVDKLIYLDNRTFGPYVHTVVHLVEPYRHAEVPLGIDQPFFLYLVTHTLPWLMITMADQSAGAAQPRLEADR
jgi:hypothetical protein